MESDDEFSSNILSEDEVLERMLAKEDRVLIAKRREAEQAHQETTSRTLATIEKMKSQRGQPSSSRRPASPREFSSIRVTLEAAEALQASSQSATRIMNEAIGEEGKDSSPKQVKKKRTQTEEPPMSGEERLAPIWDQLTRISTTVQDGKTKLNKEDRSIIKVSIDTIKRELINLERENAAAIARANAFSEVVKAQRGFSDKLDLLINKPAPVAHPIQLPQQPARKTYAGATSGAPSASIFVEGTVRDLPLPQPTVLFYPTIPDGKTSESTQKELMKVLNPTIDGFQAVRTRKIKGAGLLLQTSSTGGLNNIKNAAAKIEASGLKMVLPQGNLPKVVLYDVPKGDTAGDQALFEEIFKNNIQGKSTLTREDHLRTMRRVSLFGRKDGSTMNMIVTCHPESRKVLIDSGLCFLGWNACRVRDYLGATRCFKCHLYGHVSKFCTVDAITCRHCAASGHDLEDCPKKAEAAICATCNRFGKPANHKTGDRLCPAHRAAIEVQVRKTDYGRR